MNKLEFQEYIKEHKQLGVLLNIVSKNEEENALDGLNHEAGVLKPEDFIRLEPVAPSRYRISCFIYS